MRSAKVKNNMIKDKLKNKEIGIEKNLEFFADQVNENYSARFKYNI